MFIMKKPASCLMHLRWSNRNTSMVEWGMRTMKMFYQKTSFHEFASKKMHSHARSEIYEIIKINNNKIIAEYLLHAWNTKCHSFPFRFIVAYDAQNE